MVDVDAALDRLHEREKAMADAWTEEQARRRAARGRPRSPETRAKIRAARMRAEQIQLDDPGLHPIRRLRLERGMTVRGLAIAAGLAEITVRRAERGRGLRPKTRRRLADALDVAQRDLRTP